MLYKVDYFFIKKSIINKNSYQKAAVFLIKYLCQFLITINQTYIKYTTDFSGSGRR